MARGATRRSWVKLYITGWLHGSIRWELEPEERSVWADLICLAGECNNGGRICDNDGKPFPKSFIANQLNIPKELLDRTIAKCKHEGRLEDTNDIIVIANWASYQSEYERQKPYRQKNTDDDELVSDMCNVYEENIGIMTPMALESLKEFAVSYPNGWFKKAVEEAVKYNKRNIKYISAILKRWQVEGVGHGAGKQNPRPVPQPGDYTKPEDL